MTSTELVSPPQAVQEYARYQNRRIEYVDQRANPL